MTDEDEDEDEDEEEDKDSFLTSNLESKEPFAILTKLIIAEFTV